MMRSHAVVCVDQNGNESRREIQAKDWPDCFQKALDAGGTWRNYVRFMAADDPFKRVDRPGMSPPPALGKLGDAMDAAQIKVDKQNGHPKPAKSFDATPERRMPRGELAALFARMLPQMGETFTRLELEKRAFDSTGERYDIGDSNNALQYLKEKKLVEAIARGKYRIPADVRQGKRTLTAKIRGSVPATAPTSTPQVAEHPVQVSTEQTTITTATKPEAAPSLASSQNLQAVVAALANALVPSEVEDEEREISQILEAIERWEQRVRRQLKAVQLRKELLAMM